METNFFGRVFPSKRWFCNENSSFWRVFYAWFFFHKNDFFFSGNLYFCKVNSTFWRVFRVKYFRHYFGDFFGFLTFVTSISKRRNLVQMHFVSLISIDSIITLFFSFLFIEQFFFAFNSVALKFLGRRKISLVNSSTYRLHILL